MPADVLGSSWCQHGGGQKPFGHAGVEGRGDSQPLSTKLWDVPGIGEQ